MTHEIPNNIYREHLIELYKSPSNYGTFENVKGIKKATGTNANCGDEITMELFVEKGIIKDVRFNGSGCVMSIVSASMLTDKIKGLSLEDVKSLDREDVLKLMKVKLSPARIKCALLPLEALRKVLK